MNIRIYNMYYTFAKMKPKEMKMYTALHVFGVWPRQQTDSI